MDCVPRALHKPLMRILMLTFNVAYRGGATFYRALHLSQGLARRGHRVMLMASSPGKVLRFHEQEKMGVTMVEAPGIFPSRWRYGYDPYEVLRRITWIFPRRFDIVHAFDNRPVVIYPALAARRKGSRLVMDWCDWFGRGGAAEERANRVMRAVMGYVDTYYEEAFRHRADATDADGKLVHPQRLLVRQQPRPLRRVRRAALGPQRPLR